MFPRKQLLSYAEELLCCYKFRLCEQAVHGFGKCSPAAGTKGCEFRRGWAHWSGGASADSLAAARHHVTPVHHPLKANCFPDRMADNLEPVEMELSSSASSSDEEGSLSQQLTVYSQQRAQELTPYGLQLKSCNQLNRLGSELITVATYNVLSQSLLEMHRYLYKDCKKRNLRWSARSAALLRDFEFLNPDVFCLQEVESDHLESFFKKELGRLGYCGIYKKRTHEKVDGCAIYYKTDKFNLVEYNTVELFKENVRLLDRDNIGIVVRLSLKDSPQQHIVIATTHLLYTPRRTDIRLTQTQVMLAEIERLAFKEDKSYWPIVFTGDMNYTPDSAVYELVERGYTRYDRGDLHAPKYSGSRKDLLPRSVGVTDSCQYASALQQRMEEGSRGAGSPLFGSGALDHGLHFSSVYPHVKDNLDEATTYQDQWHTVDYIFYRNEIGNGQEVMSPGDGYGGEAIRGRPWVSGSILGHQGGTAAPGGCIPPADPLHTSGASLMTPISIPPDEQLPSTE